MKRLISTLTIASLFSTSVLAHTPKTSQQDINQAISNFKEEVLVLDKDQDQAFLNLVHHIQKENLGIDELKNYVKENSSTETYEEFTEIINFGSEEVNSLNELTPRDMELILNQVVTLTTSTGSHYRSCNEGQILLGSLLIIGAVILTFEAINKRNDYYDNVDSNSGFFSSGDNAQARRDRNDALILGSLAGFTGIAGISLVSSSCN